MKSLTHIIFYGAINNRPLHPTMHLDKDMVRPFLLKKEKSKQHTEGKRNFGIYCEMKKTNSTRIYSMLSL